MRPYGASSEYHSFKGIRVKFTRSKDFTPSKKEKRYLKHSYRHKQKLTIILFLNLLEDEKLYP